MTEERFTPGPWRIVGKTGYVNGIDNTGSAPGEVLVAKVGDFFDKELLPFNRERWTADARMISAAPDMYEELKNLIGYAQNVATLCDVHYAQLDKARAALSKAVQP